MQTWSFLDAMRVLHASAWRGGDGDEGGGRGRAGMHGDVVRVGAGKGEGSSDEGWRKLVRPCSCPLDRSEVRTPLACLADLRGRQKVRV